MSELRLAAYEALNAEIRMNSGIVANLLTVAVTGSATIIGFGVQLRQPGLFLAAFVLLIPSLTFLASQMDSTAKIAAYIVENFEGEDTGVYWETDLREFRKDKARAMPDSRQYGLSISALFVVMGAVCLVLAFYFLDYDDRRAVIAVAAASAVAVLLLGLTVARWQGVASRDQIELHRARWEKIREKREA